MTVADQVLSALASIGGGSVPVCGRVADEIGDPVPAALVRALAVGAFAGHERSRAETDAAGVFALPGLSSGGFVIVVEALGSEARLALAAPRAAVTHPASRASCCRPCSAPMTAPTSPQSGRPQVR